MKVAVCYFGLTRSTKAVYKSHTKFIHDILKENNINFDIFIHTWKTKSSKQRVWDRTQSSLINYEEYKLLNPNYYKIDPQEDFLNSIDMSKFFYKHIHENIGQNGKGEWIPELVQNHLCALESQKRVFSMVCDTSEKYDMVIMVRPDALIENPLDILQITSFFEEYPSGISVPLFGKHEGYNDQFAIMKFENAHIYCNRVDEIADFRKNHGRIVSEKYVKYICDNYFEKINFIHFNFKLVRPGEIV
jgi:hypothetical protein